MSEVFENSASYASIVCYVAAFVGSAYALFAIWAARGFVRAPKPVPPAVYPPVTILKPLHGAEPELYANLASFCRQDYPAPLQVVFGIADAADPAALVVRRLIADFPERDLELVVNARRHGANAKVSNLINMQAAARHELIVIADSDMAVSPDYLGKLASLLQPVGQAGVDVVTCLYRGGAAGGGLWSRLAAAGIDYQFLPNVLVGLKLGLATPCFGSTIALSRTTLAKLGGLQAVADQLADDYELGMAARRAGYHVAIAPFIVTHVCSEQSLRELLLHEIRWARTIRAVDPLGFTGVAVTYAVPLGLLGLALGGLTSAALVLVLALACRFAMQTELHRLFGLGPLWNLCWLGPIRDILSFFVFVASFFGRRVEWRGHRYGVRADSTLAHYGEAES